MTRIHRIFLVLVALLAAIPLAQLAGATLGSGNVTVLQGVMPTQARPGDIVTVTGFALGADRLKEIYLTDGVVDYRVEILEQNNLAVRLQVPAKIPAGQWWFAIVVVSRPEMLEQPVLLKVLPAVG
jgi:hypothetical protein